MPARRRTPSSEDGGPDDVGRGSPVPRPAPTGRRPAARGRRSAARDVRRAPPARPGAVRVGASASVASSSRASSTRSRPRRSRRRPRKDAINHDQAFLRSSPMSSAETEARARAARDPARRLRRAERRGVRRVHRAGEVLRAARRRAVVHLRGLAPGVPGRRLQPRVPDPGRATARASTGSTPAPR